MSFNYQYKTAKEWHTWNLLLHTIRGWPLKPIWNFFQCLNIFFSFVEPEVRGQNDLQHEDEEAEPTSGRRLLPDRLRLAPPSVRLRSGTRLLQMIFADHETAINAFSWLKCLKNLQQFNFISIFSSPHVNVNVFSLKSFLLLLLLYCIISMAHK